MRNHITSLTLLHLIYADAIVFLCILVHPIIYSSLSYFIKQKGNSKANVLITR